MVDSSIEQFDSSIEQFDSSIEQFDSLIEQFDWLLVKCKVELFLKILKLDWHTAQCTLFIDVWKFNFEVY